MDRARAGSRPAPPRPAWLRWAGRVLAVTMLLAIAGAVAGALWARHEGYQAYAVRTGSMSPDLPPGDLLIDAPATPPYHAGQIVTFKVPQGAVTDPVVTHRVFALHGADLRTKGDANETPDSHRVKVNDVVGEVMLKVPNGGYVLVYLSQLTGVLSLVAALLTVTFSWSLFFGTPSEPRPTA